MFAEIDDKSFGSGFDAAFSPDAEDEFGVGHLHGLEQIKTHLKKFDSKMDTKHEVLEFWDGGATKLARGRVIMTAHETPHKTSIPVFVHILEMSKDDPQKIQLFYGAVGPMQL
ncbi:MAG: nuclear transport factor 2 family protein [Brasilonema angustatum HA4187-MV1]|jgi:hypothetical protein|nr:nuclear transport factor 2 family protein [Brasilonema angustatum HA4187-MV1]